MKKIDMRCRPAIKSLNSSWIYDTESMVHFAKYFGGSYLAESAKQKSIDLLLEEMKEVEIVKGVFEVRRGGNPDTNKEAAELLEQYGDYFIGMVGVDAIELEQGLEDIDKYVLEGKFTGVNLEPGNPPAGKEPMFIDDERIFPIYEKCQENNLPVTFTFGGPAMPDCTAYMPYRVENVARTFPGMKICLCHGAWPWFTQMSNILLSYSNVFVCVDSYLMLLPGYQDYILGANYMLQDQIMFGTSYPLHSQKKVVDFYMNADFRKEVLPKVMYDNAARFLGLEKGNPQPTMYDLIISKL